MKKPAKKNRRTVKSKGRSKVPSPHYYVPAKNLSDAARSKASRERREEELPAIVEPRRIDLDEQARMRREIEARGHRYPGFDVLLRLDREGRPMTEEQFEELFQATEKAAYYFTGADAEAARRRGFGLPGEDYHKRRPGLLWETVSAFPADDRTFKRALSEGVLNADELRAFLAEVTRELPSKMEEATRYLGRKGVEVFATLIHFEQGVLHFHPYFSDVDLETHQRVGYFRKKGNKGTALVMATASPGMVAAHRYRREGLPPQPVLLQQKVTEGGLLPAKVVEDWGRLERAIETRRERLGYEPHSTVLPWDLVMSDWWDGKVRDFCRSNPELGIIHAEEWAAERALVIDRVRAERARLAGREALVLADDLVARATVQFREAKRAEAAVADREAAVDIADRLLTAEAVKLDRAEAVVDERFSEAQRQEREAAEVQRRAMQLLAEAEAKRKAAEDQMAATQRAADVTNARLKTEEEKLAVEVRRAAVADIELRNEHVRAVQAAHAAQAAIVSRAVHADFAHLLVQFWTRDRLNRLWVACQAIVTCKAKPIPDDLTFAFEAQEGRTKVTSYNLSSQTRRDLAALCELSRSAGNRLIVEDVERIFKTAEVFDLVLPSMATIKLFREACELLCDGKPITQAHANVVSDEGLRAAIMAYSTPRLPRWRKQRQFGIVNPVLDLLDWLDQLTKVEMKRRERQQSLGGAMQLAEKSGAENAVKTQEPRSNVVGDDEFDR